ncbi:MAG: putative oxidoreductase C-terminal domain-containing protein [Betaproteobacteria bacterium]
MKLTVLDPGHFHAALLQKSMYDGIDADVHVYAPAGPDLTDYVRKIEGFNTRAQVPTHWDLRAHASPDFLDRFAAERRGDIVVISGNNARKTEYLTQSVAAGCHTLADKPMAIDAAGFDAVARAFALAREQGVLLYDIMTERHEVTTMLQKAFSVIESVFGTLERGTPERPAVSKESVHHFSKFVSGAPITRPAWFFDTAQQGEGLVDITTHLVDLVQWECLPGEILDYRTDVRLTGARRWPTVITPAQFTQVTQVAAFPAFLHKDVAADGNLHVYANGEIDYVLRGIHAKVSVLWNFEAPAGAGDTHYSVLRGTRASLVIRQGLAEKYQPTLSIEPVAGTDLREFASALAASLPRLQFEFPGVDVERGGNGWQVLVPASYHVGHEAHFAQVAQEFLRYVKAGALPAWEEPNMLAKYYTTTQALALARGVS